MGPNQVTSAANSPLTAVNGLIIFFRGKVMLIYQNALVIQSKR